MLEMFSGLSDVFNLWFAFVISFEFLSVLDEGPLSDILRSRSRMGGGGCVINTTPQE